MNRSDILIIGGGPGGYEAAIYAARLGKSVTLIEASHLGGTCLNEGCIPTKCFCHSADIFRAGTSAERMLRMSPEAFSAMMARKDGVVTSLRSGLEQSLRSVNIVFGEASFVKGKDKTVEVFPADGGCVTCEEYTADNIIIATGSKSRKIPVEGSDTEGVLTSSEILNIPSQPQSLCIIGGGVIGMEFASVFSAIGTKVSVVEYFPEILTGFDGNLSKRLRTSMKARGVDFHLGSAVKQIRRSDGGLSVVFDDRKGVEASVEAELVLMATGRRPNTDTLNLQDAGISFSKKGIETDENFETSVKGIYAVGDINGRTLLAHAAKYQGIHAVNHITGKTDRIDFSILPAVVFTSPSIAMVGQTEEALREKGISYKASKAFYRANGKALAEENADGMLKVISDEDGKILGVHILGAGAADLIHEAAVLMNFSATLDDLQNIIHAHPTLSELFSAAAFA